MFNPTITKRNRRRKLADGSVVEMQRFVVQFIDPDTGRRRQLFFTLRREAEAFRAKIVTEVHAGTYLAPGKVPTVAQATGHYLGNRKTEVKASTLHGYEVVAKNIIGPLLEGTQQERAEYAMTGELPRKDARLLQLLGHVALNELTTAQIRNWHRIVMEQVGRYTANRALSMLKAILALAEEDYRVRAPSMPTNVARRRSKVRKES